MEKKVVQVNPFTGQAVLTNAKFVLNSFCKTGKGGGVDPSCGKGGVGSGGGSDGGGTSQDKSTPVDFTGDYSDAPMQVGGRALTGEEAKAYRKDLAHKRAASLGLKVADRSMGEGSPVKMRGGKTYLSLRTPSDPDGKIFKNAVSKLKKKGYTQVGKTTAEQGTREALLEKGEDRIAIAGRYL